MIGHGYALRALEKGYMLLIPKSPSADRRLYCDCEITSHIFSQTTSCTTEFTARRVKKAITLPKRVLLTDKLLSQGIIRKASKKDIS